MAKPIAPQDLFVVNGWRLNIPFPGVGNDAHFETLEGIQKQAGAVEIVDGGTNKKHRFSDQLKDYGEMTLTRTYQGNSVDRAMEIMVNEMIERGLKLPVQAIKLHHGEETFMVVMDGFKIHAVQYPTFDTNSGEKFTVSYTATCDGWDILPL